MNKISYSKYNNKNKNKNNNNNKVKVILYKCKMRKQNHLSWICL